MSVEFEQIRPLICPSIESLCVARLSDGQPTIPINPMPPVEHLDAWRRSPLRLLEPLYRCIPLAWFHFPQHQKHHGRLLSPILDRFRQHGSALEHSDASLESFTLRNTSGGGRAGSDRMDGR